MQGIVKPTGIMKVAITFLVLGIAGIAQYIYFQFTPLAFNYDVYQSDNLIHVTATRDWTVGLVGAVAGIVLLGLGVYRYRKSRAQSI